MLFLYILGTLYLLVSLIVFGWGFFTVAGFEFIARLVSGSSGQEKGTGVFLKSVGLITITSLFWLPLVIMDAIVGYRNRR